MSELATKPTTELSEIDQKKFRAWGNTGLVINNLKTELELTAQKAMLSIKTPESIEDVPAAMEKLKELARVRNELSKYRKERLKKINDFLDSLIVYEQSIEPVEQQLKTKIIEIKSAHQKLLDAKKKHSDELETIRTIVKQFLIQHDFNCRSAISNQVSKSLEWALNNDVKPENLSEYFDKCSNKFTLLDFSAERPTVKLVYTDPTEAELIFDETFHIDANAYLNLYRSELEKKFSDYTTAYANKKDALALSIKEEAEKQAELDAAKQNSEMAVNLEAAATPLIPDNVGAPVRALKKAFELDMPENQESVIQLMRAYVANRVFCDTKLKVTKWFSFTPNQMAIALTKVKNDDANFQPAGIIFKEVEKL